MLREAEKLVKAGVKELLVISQDTSAYGRDLRYAESRWRDREVRGALPRSRARARRRSAPGCGCITSIPIRMSTRSIALMDGGNVLPYLDIPFQHAAPAVLKAMKRPGNQEKTLERIRAWRAICPDLTHPLDLHRRLPRRDGGRFRLLLDWLDEAKLDRVGAFKYEPVAGARANDLGLAPVPDEIKQSRWKRFMERQQAISAKKLAAKVGKRLQVIVDEGGVGAPRAAPRATRRTSTAPSMSRPAGPCAPATS